MLSTELLITLYTKEHLTLRAIADRARVTASAVQRRLRRAGVSAKDGQWMTVICSYSGGQESFKRQRCFRNRKPFCSKECYLASRENPRLAHWKNGGHAIRAIVNKHFDLQREHVVDHKDGNQSHNELINLRVFADQDEHRRRPRGARGLVLWDGAECRCKRCEAVAQHSNTSQDASVVQNSAVTALFFDSDGISVIG
jgi:hypothetical protein